MGYYIQTNALKGKAIEICATHDAIMIDPPEKFSDIPTDMALICVVDNGPFEAAGFAYSEAKFNVFRGINDRPKEWIMMDWKLAEKLTGFVSL